MTHLNAIACMGGNCSRRETCARYHADYPARERPWERLCSRGKTQMWAPMLLATAGQFRPAVLPAFTGRSA